MYIAYTIYKKDITKETAGKTVGIRHSYASLQHPSLSPRPFETVAGRNPLHRETEEVQNPGKEVEVTKVSHTRNLKKHRKSKIYGNPRYFELFRVRKEIL